MDNKSKKLKLAAIHEILPKEILVMILKNLGYKSVSFARLACKQWKKVIDDFGLAKAALGKFKNQNEKISENLYSTILIIFQQMFHP